MVRRLLPLAVVATVLAGCAVLAHLRYGASLETSVVSVNAELVLCPNQRGQLKHFYHAETD